ncbi:MAG: Ig-like domain repeat protein [Gammaproteobacteria bacterium]|nr:Ig-like domain repeat protein [Gammaproteobacteria bacterium]
MSRHSTSKGGRGCTAARARRILTAALCLGAGLIAAPGAGADWRPTRTHAQAPREARLLGAVPDEEPVDVTVALQLRNRALLDERIRRQHTPGGPEYRRWLGPGQVLADHAPTAREADAVVAHLRRAGFTQIELAPNRLLVTARGPAAAVQQAFNTRLRRFDLRGRRGHVNVGDAQVPAEIAGTVLAVLGLQTLNEMRPLLVPAARPQLTGSVHGLNPTKFPLAYGAASLPAASTVRVGIITAGSMTQAIADLHQFQTANGLPALTPTVVTVGRAGFDTSGTAEWDLDSQTIQAMAGGTLAEMLFYTARSLLDSNITQALNRAVTDGVAAVINVSLGICETDAQADGSLAADDQIFATAVAQGQTFAVASGDDGANECGSPIGTAAGASYPASSPYVIAVGGTTLATDAAGNYGGETVWSGSGGSPSLIEPRPSWQNGVVAGATRGLPDVAFDADPNSGALIIVNGASAQYGGTSLAAPIFTAAWARIQAANDARLGFPAAWLYKYGAQHAAAFRDVVAGANGVYSAAPGWDYASGFGSFDVAATALFTRSSVSVSVVPALIQPGTTVTLTASITGNAPGGTVQFTANGAALGAPVAVANGVATLATTLAAASGTVTIGAAYSGDFDNAGSTSTVAAFVDIMTASVPLPPWSTALLAGLLGWRAMRRLRA